MKAYIKKEATMKNNIIFILSVIGLVILGDFPSAEAASLPSSPPPFYPPTITKPQPPQPISPPANPSSIPSQPAIPPRNGLQPGITNPRTGEFYPGTFGGVTNPRTGVFLPKVEGGYLNPETGEVIPKQ